MHVLVTGATGYIGGRLIPRLLEKGWDVRILVRDRRRAEQRPWSDKVEIVQGDITDQASLKEALSGVDVAYYLVHAMGGDGKFEEKEVEAARRFSKVAESRTHIIYLGGLQPESGNARAHLRSRARVGEILRADGLATEFRAGPILGSGSASFEMVRYLSERLPIQILPSWANHEIQPIGIVDVLQYLVQAAEKPPLSVVEIGADRLTFRGLLETYAKARQLRRIYLPIPFSIRSISAGWVVLITPLPLSLAFPLVDGVISSISADTNLAHEFFPSIRPMSVAEAVSRAIAKTKDHAVETSWSGALNQEPVVELSDEEGFLREKRSRVVHATPNQVFRSVTALGGEAGWPSWNWAWKVRGGLDRLAGGPGLRRGRRSSRNLYPGETLDFWRVEAMRPDQLLLLRAEMKLPGRAWLRFELAPAEGGTLLTQTALYQPRGLWGLIYWWMLMPAHAFIFGGMIGRIATTAEQNEANHVQADPT